METHTQLIQSVFNKGQKPKYHVFSPLRVCPLGAHIDHQHGIVTGFAIDQGIDLFISETENSEIKLISKNFQGVVNFKTHDIIDCKQNHWGDYVRGVVVSLRRNFTLQKGIKGVVIGSQIPIGGLSTSAALLCGLIQALIKVNNIELSKFQIVSYASYAERQYVGLKNGILDQSCVMLCEQNKLLYLDTKTQQYSIISLEENQSTLPFQIGIFFSGVTRKLIETNFNIRVDQCKTAAWIMQSFAGKQLKPLQQTRLRDVQRTLYEQHADKMPQNFRKRATHFFSELNRAQKGVQIWKQGKIRQFGNLIFQSCESSIKNYECGSLELIAIYKIMKKTDGIYGGRFSGAGFKGACFCLIDPSKKQHIKRQVQELYLKQFPQYQNSFKVFFCKTTNGSKIVQIQ